MMGHLVFAKKQEVSKQLQTLDSEVVEDREAVTGSVLNNAYIGQRRFAKKLELSLEVGGGQEEASCAGSRPGGSEDHPC